MLPSIQSLNSKIFTMSPTVDRFAFAGNRVIESVSEEYCAIGYSYLFIISNLNFLFSIVVVKFQGEIVDCVDTFRAIVSSSSYFNFRSNQSQRILHFGLLSKSVGRKIVALCSIGWQIFLLDWRVWR